MSAKPTAAWIWMIRGSLAFALMAACIKLASGAGVPVAQILFYRGAVSLLAVWIVLRTTRIPVGSPHWKAHLKRSFWSYAGMVAFFTAISRLPLATAVTLQYTSSLWLGVILLARPGEQASRSLLGVTLAGLGGVGLMLRPTLDGSQWPAAVIGLASGVTGALAALNVRDIGRLNEPPLRTVFYFSLFVAAVSAPGFFWSHPLSVSPAGVLYAIGAGLFAAVGQLCITLAYQHGHTQLVSLWGYTQVVFTTLLGILLWGDRLPLSSWLGMLIILLCGATATLLVRRRSLAGAAAPVSS
jgi:drug/metabolite transporter (DMT)-like permease